MSRLEHFMAGILRHLARLVSPKQAEPGWLAFSFRSDGLNYTHLRKKDGGRFEATLCGWAQLEPSQIDGVRKLAKDLVATRFSSILVLDKQEYQLLLIEAPKVAPDEMKTAIRWKIRDMIDYSIEDATVDLLEIPIDPTQPFRDRLMYAVVAQNQIIKQRMDLFAAAGSPLSVIDIPEMAQRNIAALFETEGRGLALLSFGDKDVLLTITCRGELYLSRHIDIPASALRERDRKTREQQFDKLILEIQRSLDHFEHQYNFISVDRVALGPLPQVEGLSEYLAGNLTLRVDELDLQTRFDFSTTPELLEPEWQARCWYSLGATLREVK